jgi:potassium-transporting ATPase ATP-binding subunit
VDAPVEIVRVQAGELIPAAGTVVEGIAAVDESAITGESAPVIRESGGERSMVIAGARVISGHLVVAIAGGLGTRSKPG